ncbi:MAG: hypothetical protein C3F13_06965 [Anaerolineales bacterium]|nr:MAG: hypothetical protein C3F13_06965 [Anaerolineales bacterium]
MDDQGNYSLYLGNLDTNEYTAVVPISYEQGPSLEWQSPFDWIGGGGISIAWSPDGSKILFSTGASQADEVRLLDVSSGEITVLQAIPDGSAVTQIMWSSYDGPLVAYELAACRNGCQGAVFIADTSDGNVIKLADISQIRSLLGWSPEGNELFYQDDQIIRYDPLTKSKKVLEQPVYVEHRWGIWYIPEIGAYMSNPDFHNNDCGHFYYIYLKGTTTPHSICTTPWGWSGHHTTISPDGKWLLIQGFQGWGPDDAFLFNIDDLSQKNLGTSLLWLLGWSPDRSSLITVIYTDGGREIAQNIWQESGMSTDFQSNYQEYASKFDFNLSSILQIAIINNETGELMNIYQFPSDIRIMLSRNIDVDIGYGLGINWLLQP